MSSTIERQALRFLVHGRAVRSAIGSSFRTFNYGVSSRLLGSGATLRIDYAQSGIGLGALYAHVLILLDVCSVDSWILDLAIKRSAYQRSDSLFDPLNEFWEPVCNRANPLSGGRIAIERIEEVRPKSEFTNFVRPSKLWQNAYRINSQYEEKITRELDLLGLIPGQYDSVHYRGSDKSSEACLLDQDQFLDIVMANVRNRPVFVSTDEETFSHRARKRLGDRYVCFSQVFSNQAGVPAHQREDVAGHLACWEAFRAMVVMSRGQSLIKTPSALSGFTKVLNPDLDVTLHGRMHLHKCWFPDALLLDNLQHGASRSKGSTQPAGER